MKTLKLWWETIWLSAAFLAASALFLLAALTDAITEKLKPTTNKPGSRKRAFLQDP